MGPNPEMNLQLCCTQLAEGHTLGWLLYPLPHHLEREELGIGQSFWAWGGE